MKYIHFLLISLFISLMACSDDNDLKCDQSAPSLAGRYNYEDSTCTEELWFSYDEPVFVYTYGTIPQGGGYSTVPLKYELAFPYIFFDPTATSQIDVKKIKIINSLEMEVTHKDGSVSILHGGRGWDHDEMDNTYTDFANK